MASRRKRRRARQRQSLKEILGQQPDMPFNGRVVRDVIDNPYNEGPAKIDVVRSVRDDPLAGMLARRQIDETQFAAGRRFQREYEAAQLRSLKAMDPTKEPVDGHGPPVAPFTERQMEAFQEISYADQQLGQIGSALVRAVLLERLTIVQVAARHGYDTEPEVKFFGRRFRECLETLAVMWGYAAPQTCGRTRKSLTGPANQFNSA